MKLAWCIPLLLLTACVSSKTITLPSGQQGLSISCNGGAHSWGDCYEEAGNKCGTAGYKVLVQNGEEGAFASTVNGNLVAGTTNHREMIVSCGK